jgi:hypothetical protein
MDLTSSEVFDVGVRMSQTKTDPLAVPTAMYRARWPGISEPAGRSMCGRGDDTTEDDSGLPDSSKISSSAVIIAYVERSIALAVICTDFRPPKLKSEMYHSVFEGEQTDW